MSDVIPSFLTCPVGHTFPYEQLTVRDGQNVCPVCDQTQWATPRRARPWSRTLLRNPLLLLMGAIVLFLVETISAIGIGATYTNENVGGAAWLIAGSAVSAFGTVLLVAGVARVFFALRSQSWTRALLSMPLLILAGGAALLTVGDLLGLGLNIAFLNASNPGATWQLVGAIFDALFFGGLAGALAWVGLLARRPDPIRNDVGDVTGA